MNSLRGRLTIILCGAAALILPAGILIAYLTVRSVLVAQFDATLAAKAQALITAAEVDEEGFEIDFDVQDFAGFGSSQSGDFFEVRRPGGALVARSPNLTLGHLPDFETPSSRTPVYQAVTLPGPHSGRAVRQTFTPPKDDPEDAEHDYLDLELTVASDSTALLQNLHQIAWLLPLLGLMGLASTLALLYVALGRGLRPLDDLADAVQGIQVGKSGQTLETATLPDELRMIGAKLNELLERVQASIERERRFANHAAHELRTPLAELRSMVELVAAWPDEATPERNAELMAVIGEMESLLEKLALISRTEGKGYSVQLAPVDLRQSVQSAIERFSDESDRRELSFDLKIEAGEFRSDTVLWTSILNNLLGNAVSHSPGKAVIRVEASPGRLAVRNPAPDLKEEDVPRLFERFWRKSSSRENTSHSGLGLSIVQSCVQVLGGGVPIHAQRARRTSH